MRADVQRRVAPAGDDAFGRVAGLPDGYRTRARKVTGDASEFVSDLK